MKKKALVLCILACIIFTFSCAGTSENRGEASQATPEWVTTGVMAQYPVDLYIIGIGSAEIKYNDTAAAQAASDSRAIAQVAKQIEVVIQQLSSSFEREVSSSSGAALTQRDIWEKTAAYVKIKVKGVRIEDRYHDGAGNRIYSFASLDRMAQAKVISDQITALESNARALIIEAEKSRHSLSKIHRSVAAYGLAIRKLILAVRKNQYLNVIAPQITHKGLSGTLSDLQTDVAQLMSGFSFQKLNGDNQKGVIGGSLRDPLQLKVLYQGKPAPSVPVSFVWIGGSGNIDRNTRSDSVGLVSTSVSNLGPTGKKINKIRAVINIYPSDPDAREELEKAIAPVYAQFTYELYNLGTRQQDSYLENQIVQSLGKLKLQVVKDIPRTYMLDSYDIGGGPSLVEKLQALSDIADLAIVGEVKATLLDTSTSSSLIFTRSRAVVKIFDLAADTEDLSLKAAGPDRDEAGRRGLQKVAAKASQAVEQELLRLLFGK
ncbi:MAG: LPP20 family lipoprotein [Deltaproteobacteria bacterium]|nr:LPP20 family lipoprotein [Deltaproteobacteria bacterium]